MNKRFRSILAIVAILLGVSNSMMWVWQSARADRLSIASVPQLIGYEGRLTDAAGNPLTGDYDMRFCLYAESTGGSGLWCEQTTVPVNAGVFSVLLGSTTPIPEPLFDGAELHLGVKVGSDDEMTPRRRVVSVGYAYRAKEASTAAYATSAGSAGMCSTAGYASAAGSADYASTAGNADTVDGLHATGFAPASHDHDASQVTSGTMPPERISGTAWTSANDGIGSGLDADTLDGRHVDEVSGLTAFDGSGSTTGLVVGPGLYEWVDIPDMSVTVDLSQPSLVIVQAYVEFSKVGWPFSAGRLRVLDNATPLMDQELIFAFNDPCGGSAQPECRVFVPLSFLGSANAGSHTLKVQVRSETSANYIGAGQRRIDVFAIRQAP